MLNLIIIYKLRILVKNIKNIKGRLVMSKVGNILKMLILLKSRGKMKISELSRELEVDKRQITRYKEALEQAGVYITSIPGRYGGYVVEGKDYLLGLNLTNEEYNALLIAQDQLKQILMRSV